MRIPSGSTNRYVYFVAVDPTDLKTREQSLTTFTVYYSLNGGTATVMTTPTVNETDTTNMPGVYELLLDESGMTTLTAGSDTEELCLHITHGSMAPVTRVIEIYRPKGTEGNTIDVTSTGAVGIDWGNVENQSTSVNLSSTTTNVVNTASVLTTNNDKTGYSLTQAFPSNFADLAITVTTGQVTVGTNNDKTGYSLTQSFPSNFADLAITAGTGQVTVGTNNDKTGYSLTQAFPTNFADLAITVTTGYVTAGTVNDKTGYSISGSKTTLDALNDISTTQVNTEVDTALSDIGLHYLVNTALPTSWAANITPNSALDYMADDGTAVYDRTTDSLQAVRDHIGDGTNLTEAGGTGDHLTAIDLPDQTMNITGNLSGSVGSVTGAVDSVTNNVGGNVTGSIGSLAAQAKADVNAEVVDALNTDPYGEPAQGAPPASTTLQNKIAYLYKFLRNKVTNDGSNIEVYNDAGSTVDHKAGVSEAGGTVTREEFITGP